MTRCRKLRGTACKKSPTGVHDWYVMVATGPRAADYCRWCGRLLDAKP